MSNYYINPINNITMASKDISNAKLQSTTTAAIISQFKSEIERYDLAINTLDKLDKLDKLDNIKNIKIKDDITFIIQAKINYINEILTSLNAIVYDSNKSLTNVHNRLIDKDKINNPHINNNMSTYFD